MQTITLVVELLRPTNTKKEMYHLMTRRNTAFANWLLTCEELKKATSKIYKQFSSERLPSAVINETIRAVKSQKSKQKARQFKRSWCGFNSQNFKIELENGLYKASFPTLEKRIGVPLSIRDHQCKWLDLLLAGGAKQGTVKLSERRGRWYVAIPLSFEVQKTTNPKIMGVDLGLRNIAVASVGTKSLFFRGNEMAFRRRRFSSRRRTLGRAKKLQAIRTSKGKESRWMTEMNHRISRQIVNFAIQEGVGIIRLEDLTGIRHSRRSKKEPGRNLHSWSHYQLREFIRYKAGLAGIAFELVNAQYTSQTCRCGHQEKQNRDRDRFECRMCGYKQHADVNAAINIAKAISGVSA